MLAKKLLGSRQGATAAYSGTIVVAHPGLPYISAYPWSAGFGTKYADPATVPSGNGNAVAFTPDGATIAVAHDTSPYISAYPWSAGFGTKYADPATVPTGIGLGVAFSPDGATIAVAHVTSPYISVYPWSSGFGTKYANPATLPTSTGRSVAFSPDGATIAVGHEASPYISAYPWSAGFGTKYTDPGGTAISRPSSDITTTNWTRSSGTNAYYTYVDEVTADDNDYLSTTVTNAGLEVKLSAVTDPQSSSGHVVRVRTWSVGSGAGEARTILLLQGSTTIATVATGNPGRTIGGQVNYTLTAAQADSITDYSDLRIRVTANTLGSGESIRFSWAELEVPTGLIPGTGRSVAFSPDGATIAVAHVTSPYISAYPWSAGFGTKYANPATLPAGEGFGGVTFTPDGATIAVSHDTSPYISVYPWSSGFGTKYANPATLPAGIGRSVAFSPDGATIAVGHVTSPYISVYPWSAGFGTKYADPATLPAGNGLGVAFSP